MILCTSVIGSNTPEHQGCSLIIELMFKDGLKNFITKYNTVSFFASLLLALSLLINLSIELLLESLAPKMQDNVLLDFSLFLMFICALILSFFILSLGWQGYKMATQEVTSNICCTVVRAVFMVCDCVVAAISAPSISSILAYIFMVALIRSSIITLVLSTYLMFFVYTKKHKNAKEWMLVVGWVFFFPSMFFCPTVIGVWGAGSFGEIFIAGFIFFLSLVSVNCFFYRGSKDEDVKGFCCCGSKDEECVCCCGSKDKDLGLTFVVQPKAALVIFLAFLFVFILFFVIRIDCGPKCQLGAPTKTKARKTRDIPGHSTVPDPDYPICYTRWSSIGLSITDMAFLADLAYKMNNKRLDPILNDYFKDRNISWDLVFENSKKPSFFHVRNAENRVNIVSIKGTSDSRDWFENVKIWNEIAIFQIIGFLISTKILPDYFISKYVSFAAMFDYIFEHANSYWKVIDNYLVDMKNYTWIDHKEEYILVGHSLGGGLAKIIGSRNHLMSIGFSSPGDIYNHIKYNYTVKDVQKYTTTIGARNDPLMSLDSLGGLVFKIECKDCGVFKAHSIKNTYCSLKKLCKKTAPIKCI